MPEIYHYDSEITKQYVFHCDLKTADEIVNFLSLNIGHVRMNIHLAGGYPQGLSDRLKVKFLDEGLEILLKLKYSQYISYIDEAIKW